MQANRTITARIKKSSSAHARSRRPNISLSLIDAELPLAIRKWCLGSKEVCVLMLSLIEF